MKKNLFFVCMMVALMAASVNLTSCSKSDSDPTEKPADPAQTSLNGTWFCATANHEIEMAMTFDKGNSVVVFIEGVWFFCEINRTSSHMILTGNRINMQKFTDFGTFTAFLGAEVTINLDYGLKNGLLVISNIQFSSRQDITPKPRYELTFDKVYDIDAKIFGL